METIRVGGLTHVGVKLNKEGRPSIYLEKHYPIEGRKDFYKWVIQTPKGLAKDFEGNVMYFDNFALETAKDVLRAKRKVARL